MLTLWRHYMTLNRHSMCQICKNEPGVITISLNDHGSERFEQIWWVYNVLEFSPLTDMRTWPEVNHIRIPRYTRCRYQMVYQILRFSNLPLHHCGCGTIANFFWRLSHLTWPGDLSWGDLESNFSQNVRKRCQNSFCFALSWKTSGKGEIQTPRVDRRASYPS